MQRVSVANLRPGMVPAYNVFSSDGIVLVRSGIALNEQFVKRLQTMGIGSIYIHNPMLDKVEIPELINEELRKNTVHALKEGFTNVGKTGQLNIDPIYSLGKSIVEAVTLNSDALIQVVDTRPYREYIYGHSVNLCILSVLTGLMMGYNNAKLCELALGALLHDVGYTFIDQELLYKPGKLTKKEFDVIHSHAEVGFEYLRKVREVSSPAAHIAYQHHENFDGSGYPRGLKGNEIHEYARIVTIADMYDALISDRPFRKAFLPHEAYELLMTLTQKYLDRDILEVFLSNIAIYPIGSIVKINSGELAVVKKVFPRLQARPVVQVVLDKEGKVVKEGSEINLAENLTTFIVKTLKEQEVLDLMEHIKK